MNDGHAPLFFVSDAHLGAGTPDDERHKSEWLHGFWDYVLRSGGDLVIVGDLFDFWFEFRHAIPHRHFDHLVALRQLTQAGRNVHYVAGNHDFWAGRFFQEHLGIQFHPDEFKVLLSGKQVAFVHGDGWLPAERGYRMMRRVLRHPVPIRLFQMLSPDIGFPLANWVAGRSRGRHRLDEDRMDTYAHIARGRLEGSTDILVTAHLHQVSHLIWPEGQWLVAGDWMHHFSFGVIENGTPRLLKWDVAGVHQPVAAIHMTGEKTSTPA